MGSANEDLLHGRLRRRPARVNQVAQGSGVVRALHRGTPFRERKRRCSIPPEPEHGVHDAPSDRISACKFSTWSELNIVASSLEKEFPDAEPERLPNPGRLD